jgi:hypothetical protein
MKMKKLSKKQHMKMFIEMIILNMDLIARDNFQVLLAQNMISMKPKEMAARNMPIIITN